MKPTYKFDSSLIWSLRKVIFVMSQIRKSFYQQKGFYLLTDKSLITPAVHRKTVYIQPPLMRYLQEVEMRDLLEENDMIDLLLMPEDIIRRWFDKYPLPDELIRDFETNREAVVKTHLEAIESDLEIVGRFIGKENEDLSLDVHVASFGTRGSFAYQDDELHIYPRFDSDGLGIISMVIGVVLEARSPEMDWESRQSIQDFLAGETKIGKETIASYNEEKLSPEKRAELTRISDRNFGLLGYPPEVRFNVEKGEVYYNGKQVTELSDSEKRIARYFIQNKGELVSYFDLGDVLWDDSDDYSLEALMKCVERLRKKFYNVGIKQDVILTVRNKGYLFVDN